MTRQRPFLRIVRRCSPFLLSCLACLTGLLASGSARGDEHQAPPVFSSAAPGAPPAHDVVHEPAPEAGHEADHRARPAADHDAAPEADHKASGAHHGAHGPVHRVHVGFTGSALWGFTPEGTASHVGGGLFADFVLIPHHLELGTVFHAHSTKDALEFPIDLLLIKPFALSRHVHPFLGAGLTVIPVLGTSTFDINAGLATSFGLHLWLRPDIAMVFEGNFNYICERAYSRPRGAPAVPGAEGATPTGEPASEVHGGAWGPEVGFNSGFLIAF